MKFLYKFALNSLITSVLSIFLIFNAHAHLMLAQHGTLNVVDGGVFMVISLPVSAFDGVDDDKDGKLSLEEFNIHRSLIAKTVKNDVVLSNKGESLLLQGMMLSPVTIHGSPEEPATQLVVMGRFKLDDTASALQYQINLFGKRAAEKVLKITATHKGNKQKSAFELTAESPEFDLFQ